MSVRRDHSEKCSSEADSSSESEGEFTIKTNSHVSSAMTLVLSSRESCCRSQSVGHRSGWGKGEGEGEGEGREGLAGRWDRWAGRGRRSRGERCCAEAADNSHTRGQAFRMA